MRKEQQENKYLDVEGIVTFSFKVTFPIPVWVVGKGDKCAIHKTPSTSPGLARMGLDPVIGLLIFIRGWETHSQLPELWMEDSCHNLMSYMMNHPLGDTSPVCNTLETGTISIRSKLV